MKYQSLQEGNSQTFLPSMIRYSEQKHENKRNGYAFERDHITPCNMRKMVNSFPLFYFMSHAAIARILGDRVLTHRRRSVVATTGFTNGRSIASWFSANRSLKNTIFPPQATLAFCRSFSSSQYPHVLKPETCPPLASSCHQYCSIILYSLRFSSEGQS